jgi:hypothetical protein
MVHANVFPAQLEAGSLAFLPETAIGEKAVIISYTFFIVTAPIEPIVALVYKSKPSSILLCAIQPTKLLPSL